MTWQEAIDKAIRAAETADAVSRGSGSPATHTDRANTWSRIAFILQNGDKAKMVETVGF